MFNSLKLLFGEPVGVGQESMWRALLRASCSHLIIVVLRTVTKDKEKIIWRGDIYTEGGHESKREYRLSGSLPLKSPRCFGRNCEADC